MARKVISPGRLIRFASASAAGQWRRYARLHGSRALAAAGIAPGARIHVGCGSVRFDGWVNVDLERSSEADVLVDLRGGLPLKPRSVSRIYSEHVLEHFSLEDGRVLFRDFYNSLEDGGVARIAMPDLANLVSAYLGDWRRQDWLEDPVYSDIDTASHMLNVGFRSWGHRYLYDFDDLALRLSAAGFSAVSRCEWGKSEHPDLVGLERRPDSMLIVEATH
jgi:predicted SAM-dependent methyltransferase